DEFPKMMSFFIALLDGFGNGESDPAFAKAIAVVQHVSPARDIKDPRVFDHLGIPTRAGDLDPGPGVLSLPAQSVRRDSVADAVSRAAHGVPHLVTAAFLQNEGPAKSVFVGLLVIDRHYALSRPVRPVLGLAVLDVV